MTHNEWRRRSLALGTQCVVPIAFGGFYGDKILLENCVYNRISGYHFIFAHFASISLWLKRKVDFRRSRRRKMAQGRTTVGTRWIHNPGIPCGALAWIGLTSDLFEIMLWY